MRVLLAMLVGLAQVAGPWLCCCGPARAATPAAVTPAPAETCPHCKCKATELPAKQSPTLPDPCPCGGKATEPAPPAKTEPAVAFDLDPPAFVGPVARPAAVVLLPPVGVSELPFLPPGARLYVHHVLRC